MAVEKQIVLPDIGDFPSVEVIEILVSEGDTVAVEDSLITLESDKATMEIPSTDAGVVKKLQLSVGDSIGQGDNILVLELADDSEVALEEELTPEENIAEQQEEAIDELTSVQTEKQIVLPDIGDFPSVEVIEVLVSEGDTIAVEDSLITLESDKATMEIPSSDAGVVKQIQVAVGDSIGQGGNILVLQLAAGSSSSAAIKNASAVEEPAERNSVTQNVADPADRLQSIVAQKPADEPVRSLPKNKAHASPAVRRFARELGVDLTRVTGTGNKQRILKDDVQSYVKETLSKPGAKPSGEGLSVPAAPEIDFSKYGEIEVKPLGRIKKISGAHLHRSWVTVPHVTQFDEADITNLEAFRKEQKGYAEKSDIKLTFMPFLIKACAAALKEFPQFNSSLSSDGESLILKKYVHIGVAVDTPNGLMVPVLTDVDKKGVFDLAIELMDISQRTRDGKLTPSEMQGGCFSISSLGGIGGTQFTPIVNSPEVCILGISKAAMKPVWNGSEFDPKLIMPFSLSYDHRVIDGAEGVRFTTYLGQMLGDIRKLLL